MRRRARRYRPPPDITGCPGGRCRLAAIGSIRFLRRKVARDPPSRARARGSSIRAADRRAPRARLLGRHAERDAAASSPRIEVVDRLAHDAEHRNLPEPAGCVRHEDDLLQVPAPRHETTAPGMAGGSSWAPAARAIGRSRAHSSGRVAWGGSGRRRRPSELFPSGSVDTASVPRGITFPSSTHATAIPRCPGSEGGGPTGVRPLPGTGSHLRCRRRTGTRTTERVRVASGSPRCRSIRS